MTCGQCDGIERQFGPEVAEQELRTFRRKGPIRTTRLLIAALRVAGVDGCSLLDIGGGIGALHHVLLDAGVSGATQVDASTGYLDVARGEAARRGHGDRSQFVHGDFVQLAPALPAADIVTLDRVICCYHDMESLVGHAADKSRRLLAAVYPRDAWWMVWGVAIINRLTRLRGSPFRVFVHSVAAIDERLRERGLHRTSLRSTLVWHVAVYRRPT